MSFHHTMEGKRKIKRKEAVELFKNGEKIYIFYRGNMGIGTEVFAEYMLNLTGCTFAVDRR